MGSTPIAGTKIQEDRTSIGGIMPQQQMYQLVILVVFIAAMYFLLIKPQRKKDKETQEMRNSVQVGDEIVTIGGICGKVVKTKDESIVIQVGADKTKLEFKRWAISTVDKKAGPRNKDYEPVEEKKAARPKRLGKKAESLVDEAPTLNDELVAEADHASESVSNTFES